MNFSAKSKRLERLIRERSIKHFVETGTYQGRMVDFVSNLVEHIWSCELDKTLAAAARSRFQGNDRIAILEGDSGVLLDEMLVAASGECSLVWLDAHYSGGITALGPDDSPIARELITVMRYKPSVVVIDDRRCMGANGWPTQEKIIAQLIAIGYECSLEGDSVIAVLS